MPYENNKSKNDHRLSSFDKRSKLGHSTVSRQSNPNFTPTPKPASNKTYATPAPTRQATPTPSPALSKAEKTRQVIRKYSPLSGKAKGKSLGTVKLGGSKIIRGSTESGKPMSSEGMYLKFNPQTERSGAAGTGVTVGDKKKAKQRRSRPIQPRVKRRSMDSR